MSRPKHHIMAGCPLPFSISAATPYPLLCRMRACVCVYISSAFWWSSTVRIYVCMHDGKLVMPSNITCQHMYVCFYNSKHGKAVHPIYYVWTEKGPSGLEQNKAEQSRVRKIVKPNDKDVIRCWRSALMRCNSPICDSGTVGCQIWMQKNQVGTLRPLFAF
jgi:hypothetical protein